MMLQRQFFLLSLLAAICNGLGSNCGGTTCYKPLHSTPEPTTEERETLLSRCWAVCVDKIQDYCPTCSLEPSLQGQWNSLPYYAIRDNCTIFQQLTDCQRGCTIAHSSINSSTNCANQCMSQCPNASQYDTTNCNVECDNFTCGIGCKIYSETNDSSLLPTPVKEPTLISTATLAGEKAGGQYIYNFMHNVESPIEGSGGGILQPIGMTTFVFKVIKGNTSFFFSKTTSGGILELGFLSCEENVRVSYRAVTHEGTSNYSQETIIDMVDGSVNPVVYPGQVTQLRGYFEDDDRDGYARHAISYISWQKPENSEFITHYSLGLLSVENDCGGVNKFYEYCIDKDETSIKIVAQNNTEPLLYQCHYKVHLISHPRLETTLIQGFSLNVKPVSDPEEPELHCSREFQPSGNLKLYAVWTADYDDGLIEAIQSFVVILTAFDLSTGSILFKEVYNKVDIKPQINKTIYVYEGEDFKVFDNANRVYRIRLEARKNQMFPWRTMPPPTTCYINAQPEEPSTLNSTSIDITKLIFTDTQLFFNASWEPPLTPNGRLTKYELRISRNVLQPSESDEPTDYSYIHTTKRSEPEVLVNTTEIYEISKISCLYLQIRSKNDYLWSNWSDPVLLYKYPSNPSCDFVPTIATIETTHEPKGQRHVGTIVGGFFGGLFVILIFGLLFAGVFVLCRRYRRRNRYLQAFKDVNSNALYIRGPMSPAVFFPSKSLDSPKLDEWEIPANLVVIEKKLGEGCFGEVFQGVVKGPINNSKVQPSFKNAMCPVVAIKLLKSTASGSEKNDFLQEIETMKCVAKGNNPHVVNMIGCVTIQEPLCLITEFVKHGDLLSYLQSIRKTVAYRQNQSNSSAKTGSKGDDSNPYMIPALEVNSPSRQSNTGTVVSIPDGSYAELGEIDSVNLLSFAYQIASGMEFLASLGIVHRDLACRNILVDDGKSLKISDFGMSRMVAVNDVYVKNSRGRMPWKWMAIESITKREFTSASDVWAYGVTLWEIATLGGFPYPMITNAELLEHLEKGMRLEKPENCSQDVYNIMLECWKADPAGRLTFTALRAKFDGLISAQQDHPPYIDLDIDDCKPYYITINSDSVGKQLGSDACSITSTGSISPLPRDISNVRYDIIRPMLDATSEGLPRPIENPYVDTPTKTKAHEVRFTGGDPQASAVLESPLKKGGGGGLMAEVA